MLKTLLLALLVLSFPPSAIADERGKVEKGIGGEDILGRRTAGPKYVQLNPVMAPVVRLDGRSAGQTPVTVVLKIDNEGDVGRVCRLSPRLNDAIMGEFYRHPLRLDPSRKPEDRLLLQEAEPGLVAPINRAIGDAAVSQVFVIGGARSGSSGAMSRLPFAGVLGCREIAVETEK